MKSLREVIVKCVLLLRISGSAAWEKSIGSQASPNNHILLEERTTSLKSYDTTVLVSSDIPVTIQRYKGDATLPDRGGCQENPLGESEAIILVTSNCDTSSTTVIPNISLGEVANEWGSGSSVTSINITLDLLPAAEISMDFLGPSSYKMERSYTGCTEIYCGENPWATGPTIILKRPTTSPTENPSGSPTGNPSVSPTSSPTKNPTTESPTTESPTKSPTTGPVTFESIVDGTVNVDTGKGIIGAGDNEENGGIIDGSDVSEPSDPEDYITEENGAFCPQSVIFGLLAHAKGARSIAADKSQQETRALDTCTYNAEIFINGCVYDRLLSVTAPTVRVADANATFMEVITAIDEKMSEFNETVDFTFPQGQITNLNSTAGEVVQIGKVNAQCYCCACVGRPYIDASGSKLQAMPVVATDSTCSWSGYTMSNDDECKAAEQAPTQNELILGKDWTQSALAEHASVASFCAFSIALMTNGAPSNLVEDALRAGLDEIRHAEISFEIASKLTGADAILPGPLPKSTHIFQQNMTEMAMAVAREGCIDETLSALAAAAEAEAINTVLETGSGMSKYLNMTEPTLIRMRDELHKIAFDESNHSALAWRTIQWVCSVDVEACRAVSETVLEKKKLAIAFHRRFGGLNIDRGALLSLMTAWSKISTILESSKINTDDEIHGHMCAESDSDNTSLLTSLVDNILLSVTCNT